MTRLLVFAVEGTRYGVRAEHVREVLRAVAVSRLPRAPAVVLGVIDVRGTLVPVLDLRARFGLPAKALHPDEHLVLADAGERVVAFRADRVLELAEADASAFADPREAVPSAELVAGAARLADGLVLVHDPAAFLTAAEGETLDAALETAEAAP